jgi:hypothetical protein
MHSRQLFEQQTQMKKLQQNSNILQNKINQNATRKKRSVVAQHAANKAIPKARNAKNSLNTSKVIHNIYTNNYRNSHSNANKEVNERLKEYKNNMVSVRAFLTIAELLKIPKSEFDKISNEVVKNIGPGKEYPDFDYDLLDDLMYNNSKFVPIEVIHTKTPEKSRKYFRWNLEHRYEKSIPFTILFSYSTEIKKFLEKYNKDFDYGLTKLIIRILLNILAPSVNRNSSTSQRPITNSLSKKEMNYYGDFIFKVGHKTLLIIMENPNNNKNNNNNNNN